MLLQFVILKSGLIIGVKMDFCVFDDAHLLADGGAAEGHDESRSCGCVSFLGVSVDRSNRVVLRERRQFSTLSSFRAR